MNDPLLDSTARRRRGWPTDARIGRWLVLAACLGLVLAAPAAAQGAGDDVPEVARDLIERGQRQQQDGRTRQAIETFESARELAPQVVDIYLGLGASHLAEGDAEASLEAFTAGLEVDATHRNLLFNAAVIGLRLGRLDQAVEWTRRAIEHHGRDVELHVVHATVLGRLDRDREALEALERADELSPRTPSILFRLGNQLHKVGDDERAIRAYRDALAEDPDMLRAQYNLGAVLFELERYDEALEAYGVALAPFDRQFAQGSLPEAIHARAYANLGAIHSQRQDWSAAIGAYDKALRLEPGQTTWLYNRGYVHFRAGHDDAARSDYTAALAADAELPLAYLHLGQLDRRAGSCSDAVGRLEQGLPRFDNRQRLAALEMMAFCYSELGRPERAETAFRDVLDASPDDPELLLGLGRLLRRQRRADEAQDLLTDALELRPGHLPTQLELLALAESAGDTDLQRTIAQGLLDEHGERPELWRVRWSLALLMLGEGRLADARGHLGQLAESDAVPTSERPRVAALEAATSAAEGDLEAARRQLRRASRDGEASAAAAVLDALDGEVEQAVEVLARTTATADGTWTADQSNLGLLAWSLGQFDVARAPLIAAAGTDTNPAVAAALGDLALRDGDATRAIGRIDRATTACDTVTPPPTEVGVLRVRLPPQRDGLCEWTEQLGRRARLQGSLDRLAAGRRPRRDAAQVVDAILSDRNAPTDERRLALYVRGMLDTGSRSADGIADLRAAIDADLPDELRSAAGLELGIRLSARGDHAAARQAFEAVRSTGDRAARLAATLNLAILLDDHLDDSQAALGLYESYLRDGGDRPEVASWVTRLREIYR